MSKDFLKTTVNVTFLKDYESFEEVTYHQGGFGALTREDAYELEQQGIIQLSEDYITKFSRVFNRERLMRPNTFSELDRHFYKEVEEYLSRNDPYKNREAEVVLQSLQSFIQSRLGKIARLAVSSPLTAELESKLAEEEIEIYNTIYEQSTQFKQRWLLK